MCIRYRLNVSLSVFIEASIQLILERKVELFPEENRFFSSRVENYISCEARIEGERSGRLLTHSKRR